MSDLPEPLFTVSPECLGGAPVFTGTRVPVSRAHAVAVLELARAAAVEHSSKAAAE